MDKLVMDDLDDLLAGGDGFGDGRTGGLFLDRLDELAGTSSETSASSSATRTSRIAVRTSSSDSAPCLVRRSKTPDRR
jgi:hypothetical protein